MLHSWHFFIRKESAGLIHYDHLTDLKPWRINVTRVLLYPELAAAMTDPSYHFQEDPINQLQLRKLIAGRIDVVPMSPGHRLHPDKRRDWKASSTTCQNPQDQPYFSAWTRFRADADTPALMAAYDAELLHMKRDGQLKALYDKYGIPISNPDPPVRVSSPAGSCSARTGSITGEGFYCPQTTRLKASHPAGSGFAAKSASRWTGSAGWSGSCGSAPSATSSMERVITFMKML